MGEELRGLRVSSRREADLNSDQIKVGESKPPRLKMTPSQSKKSRPTPTMVQGDQANHHSESMTASLVGKVAKELLLGEMMVIHNLVDKEARTLWSAGAVRAQASLATITGEAANGPEKLSKGSLAKIPCH